MLDLKQIESFYPENLRPFKQNLLREYLQYKILEIIFNSKWAHGLSFMGGTAIRMVHANTRFSEDLDFDNLSLDKNDFTQLAELICEKMRLQGYQPEIKNVFTDVFRTYLRIPDILFESDLTQHSQEKILIQIDTQPQKFLYKPEKIILNKFDVFLQINVVPIDILAAQKIYAIFNRKRAMGRDFFDVVFLLGKTKPNMDYLQFKLKIKDPDDLHKRLLSECQRFDFKQLAGDVEQFLFQPSEANRILLFEEYIKGYKF